MNSQSSEAQPEAGLRKCSGCNRALPPSEFYLKGSRLDSSCKSCKKARRRDRYRQAQAPVVKLESKTTEITKPALADEGGERPCIEPQQNRNFWDTKYGRPLSEEEHREIRFNLMALLDVLSDVRVGEK